MPFQLGTNGDEPSSAVENEHEIEDNDIIVLASDGVLDNLYDSDVKKCLRKHMEMEVLERPRDAAQCIANVAYKKSIMEHYESPYATNARKLGHEDVPLSGKKDDITVIVAQIHPEETGPSGKQRRQKISTNGPKPEEPKKGKKGKKEKKEEEPAPVKDDL